MWKHKYSFQTGFERSSADIDYSQCRFSPRYKSSFIIIRAFTLSCNLIPFMNNHNIMLYSIARKHIQ